jgi:hypothetical protein
MAVEDLATATLVNGPEGMAVMAVARVDDTLTSGGSISVAAVVGKLSWV